MIKDTNQVAADWGVNERVARLSAWHLDWSAIAVTSSTDRLAALTG